MNCFKLLSLVTLTSICWIPVRAGTASGPTRCEAYDRSEAVYSGYRQQYPFHFQTIGVAEYQDQSALFLISEPTPEVSESALRQVFEQYDYILQVKEHRLGYDGFIKDVLVVVAPVSSTQVISIKKALHRLLFGSDYKAERATLKLPVSQGREFFSAGNLNYQVSLAELHDWFIINKEPFLLTNGERADVSTLLNKGEPGVYFSDKPGFVAWVIPKRTSLTGQKPSIRQFVLDSDLLLGAFSNVERIVIIGRERVSSLSELPPLCMETILMLASWPNPQLSQSLDMLDVLAGRVPGHNLDWCPTYLSPALENTEFGNLLTITDILLKGWSEHGQLKNLDFKYPAPARYPFDKPIMEYLRGEKAQSAKAAGSVPNSYNLVYNWNTSGAVYSMRIPECSIYAVSSTGALPVSYFNDQYSGISIGKEYESRAYAYFAGINNTDLARVVQYQTLYSLFFDNGIYTHMTGMVETRESKKAYLLQDWMHKLLSGIKDASEENCKTLVHNAADAMVRETFKDIIAASKKEMRSNFEKETENQLKKQGLSRSDPQVAKQIENYWRLNEEEFNRRAEEAISTSVASYETEMLNNMEDVRSALGAMNAMDIVKTGRYLSYPRGEELQPHVDVNKMRRISKGIHGMVMTTYTEMFKAYGVDLAAVMDYYSRSLKDYSKPWIKTPTLVRTYEGPNIVGGHNLQVSLKRVSSLTEYVPRFNLVKPNVEVRLRDEVISSNRREHRGL